MRWSARIGGLTELKRRTLANYQAIEDWVARTGHEAPGVHA